jgi:surfeit locus 1 family protein
LRQGGGLVLACAAAGIAMLCGLGIWQVQRLHWKNDLIARLEKRMAAPAVPLAEGLTKLKAGEDVEYLRVAVEAAAGPHKTLLKQATYHSLAGWEGLGGFVSVDGTQVLVDLGASAERVTEVAGPAKFEALLRRHGLGQGRFDPINNVAQNQWFWWDLPAMQQALGLKDSPAVVLQLIGAHEGSAFEPAAPKVELNNNHLGYAVTWFGLAAALAGVAGAFVFGRERR